VRRGWTHRQGWTKPVRVYALAPSAVCPHLLRQDGSLFGFNPVTGVESSGFDRDLAGVLAGCVVAGLCHAHFALRIMSV
jgi:hypothetical protein